MDTTARPTRDFDRCRPLEGDNRDHRSYIPTAKCGLVRDHFARLGFVQTGSQNGQTAWQLAIGNYGGKELPLKVDVQRAEKLAAASGS